MKTNRMILAAVSAAALLWIPQTALGADGARSPKLRQWQEQNRRVIGLTEVDRLERGVRGKSPKLLAQEHESRRGSGRTTDLIARGPTGVMPRLLANEGTAARPWGEDFVLAPVK